jgi:hypothetical protein
MFLSTSSRGVRLVLAGAALASVLALPSAALADTTGGTPSIQPAYSRDATVQVAAISVTAKVIANVTLTYTCAPFQSYDWDTGQTFETTDGSIEGGQVVVLQAQGRTVDWGLGDVTGRAICDGTTVNTVIVPVSAAVSPWKTGSAVAGATIFLSDVATFSDSDAASSGPVAIRLTGH